MVGIAQGNRGDAVLGGAPDGVAHGMGRQHLAHRIAAVDHRDSAGIDHVFRLGDRSADAGLEPGEIPREPQHAVRLVASEVGLDQGIGDQPRIGRRHAGRLVDRRREVDQRSGGEALGLAQLPSR